MLSYVLERRKFKSVAKNEEFLQIKISHLFLFLMYFAKIFRRSSFYVQLAFKKHNNSIIRKCLSYTQIFSCVYMSYLNFSFAIKLLQPHVYIFVLQFHIWKLNKHKILHKNKFRWKFKCIIVSYTLKFISKHCLKLNLTIYNQSDKLTQKTVFLLVVWVKIFILSTGHL